MNRDELEEYIEDVLEDVKKRDSEIFNLNKSKLPKDFIKDEDQSVKWNKQYVIDTNNDILKQIATNKLCKDNLMESARDAIEKYLVEWTNGYVTHSDYIRMGSIISDDDYYFNDGVWNTIIAYEELADLIYCHETEKDKNMS